MNPNQATQPAKDSQIGINAESSISNTHQHNSVSAGVASLFGRSLVDTGGTAPGSLVTVTPANQQLNLAPTVSTTGGVPVPQSAPSQATPAPASQLARPTPATSAADGVSTPGSAPSKVTPIPVNEQPSLTPATSMVGGVTAPKSAPSQASPATVSQQPRPAGATASADSNPNPTSAPSEVTPTPVSQQARPAGATNPAGRNSNPTSAASQVPLTLVSQQARPAGASAPEGDSPDPTSAASKVTPTPVSQQARPAGATNPAGGNPNPTSITTNAVPNIWTLGLKDKIHAIHLPLSLELASGFRNIGVTDDVIQESGECEAQRLTDELMEGIEKYGFQRARITTVSPEKIMVQFSIIASSVKSGSSALQSSVFQGQGGQVSSQLDTKIFDTLLETSLPVANTFVRIGIAEEVAREAAHAEAARLTEKLKGEVEKYGVFRAQHAEVSVDRILRHFAKIAGVAWEPSPKQTNAETKGKAKGSKGKGKAKGKTKANK